MKLVLDTNILLSALIRDSTTREIIKNSEWEFYYPEMSLHEIRKYKDLVLTKTKLTEKEYDELLASLLEEIQLVPDEQILSYLEEAKKKMLKIDPNDVVFIAASLSLKKMLIWTDDSDFDRQDAVHILKTKDVMKLFVNLTSKKHRTT